MPVKRGPYNLGDVQSKRAAQQLSDMLRRSHRGRITGVLSGVILSNGQHEYVVAGRLDDDPIMAYYIASELVDRVRDDARRRITEPD